MNPPIELTDEQLRIRIAEFCGWKNVHWYEDNQGPPILSGIPTLTEEEVFKLSASRVESLRKYGDTVPNYPGSLDAMHEAEEHLAKVKISGCRDASDNQDFYHRNLIKVCWADQDFHQGFKVSHASARQRALALVRTISQPIERKEG